MAEYDGIFDAVVGVAQGGAQFFKATCKYNTGSGDVTDGETGTILGELSSTSLERRRVTLFTSEPPSLSTP